MIHHQSKNLLKFLGKIQFWTNGKNIRLPSEHEIFFKLDYKETKLLHVICKITPYSHFYQIQTLNSYTPISKLKS